MRIFLKSQFFSSADALHTNKQAQRCCGKTPDKLGPDDPKAPSSVGISHRGEEAVCERT